MLLANRRIINAFHVVFTGTKLVMRLEQTTVGTMMMMMITISARAFLVRTPAKPLFVKERLQYYASEIVFTFDNDRGFSGADWERASSDKVILDVGCGDGKSTLDLQTVFRRHRVIGVDKDVSCIRDARKKYAHLKFLVDDARRSLLPNGFADSMVMKNVLGSLCASDVSNIMTEMKRVLRGDKTFLICEDGDQCCPTLLQMLTLHCQGEMSTFHTDGVLYVVGRLGTKFV